MTKHTKWSVIASKVKTHYSYDDKTTSLLLIHDIVRVHSSHERLKDLQQDVKIATHVEALMGKLAGATAATASATTTTRATSSRRSATPAMTQHPAECKLRSDEKDKDKSTSVF